MLSSDKSTNASEPPPSPSPLAPIALSSPETDVADRPKTRSSKTSSKARRETIVLIFVIMFMLNSMNGKKIIQSVNSQFDDLSKMVYYSPLSASATASASDTEKLENISTAVIVTSSWIPSHPSTYMVDTVVNSTIKHIVGLSLNAPIFITIDHFRFSDFANLPPDLEKRINALEEYQINLLYNYLTDPRIHVIPAAKQLHIGGSVMKALNLIEKHFPTVRYVYYLQHDFYL